MRFELTDRERADLSAMLAERRAAMAQVAKLWRRHQARDVDDLGDVPGLDAAVRRTAAVNRRLVAWNDRVLVDLYCWTEDDGFAVAPWLGLLVDDDRLPRATRFDGDDFFLTSSDCSPKDLAFDAADESAWMRDLEHLATHGRPRLKKKEKVFCRQLAEQAGRLAEFMRELSR